MLKKCKQALVLFLTIAILAACHSAVYNQTEGNVADVKLTLNQQFRKSDASGKKPPSLLVRQGPYVDMTPVSLANSPTWLKSYVVIRGDQLPFSYYSRTIANGAGNQILTKYQVGLDPAVNLSMSYSGSIQGALDLLASKTGYVYSIRGNKIYWQAYITRTFDVAFMPGGTDYMMGKSSQSTSSQASSNGQQNYTTTDSSDAEYSNLSGKLSIWTDIDTTVKQLLSPNGSSTVSQATTSVTVRDKPTNVELVGQYINNLNHALSKQVLIKVQILEVNLENDYDFGIDWAIVTKAFNRSPFKLTANYGTPIAITALASQASGVAGAVPTGGTVGNGKLDSYTILFNALNQQGKTSVVTEPRVVCLNNQVGVIRIVDSEGYVASIQNTSAGSGTGTLQQNTVTSQITPGTLVTGLTLYMLPKIIGDRIYMQVNADISRNLGFTTVSGGSVSASLPASQVQLPRVTEKHFNQRSMLKSGDTLILSGFRQVANQANAMQFLKSQALGGKGSQELSKETIVLITPIVLNGKSV